MCRGCDPGILDAMRVPGPSLPVAAIAAIASTAILAPAAAPANPIQSITAKVSPWKLPPKKFKKARLRVEVLTKPLGRGPRPEQPPRAKRTRIDLPKDLKFDSSRAHRCRGTERQLEGTTTAAAEQVCGKNTVVSTRSKVPTGPEPTVGTSAWITVDRPGAGKPLGVPVVVTAFNGAKKDQLFLHARARSLGETYILVGRLGDGPKGYGRRLDVRIPPLDEGGFSRFTVTIAKGRYVRARCKDREMRYSATTSYEDHRRTADAYKRKCKPVHVGGRFRG